MCAYLQSARIFSIGNSQPQSEDSFKMLKLLDFKYRIIAGIIHTLKKFLPSLRHVQSPLHLHDDASVENA